MTNTAALKAELNRASEHRHALAVEVKELPAKIQDASRAAALQKAENARAGEQGDQLLAVSADLDVEEMVRRQQAAPLELWAARLHEAEISRDLVSAQIEELELEAAKAGSAYATALARAQEAERASQAAYSEAMFIESRLSKLKREDLKRANATVTELENGAPGV